MSAEATAWAFRMGRELNLKPATRFVLLTLANEAGSRPNGFYTYQEYLAADTGMSLSAVKNHLALLRKAHLVIKGDQRMVEHIESSHRPCVYRLNLTIHPDACRALLGGVQPVDNPPAEGPEWQPESGHGQNLAITSPESSGFGGSQNLAGTFAESSGSGSQNLATNPLKGGRRPAAGGGRPIHKKKNDDPGVRLCVECLGRMPVHQMFQREGGGYVCESHAA